MSISILDRIWLQNHCTSVLSCTRSLPLLYRPQPPPIKLLRPICNRNLKNDAKASNRGMVENVEDLDLCYEVFRCHLDAFECDLRGRKLVSLLHLKTQPFTCTNSPKRELYVHVQVEERELYHCLCLSESYLI